MNLECEPVLRDYITEGIDLLKNEECLQAYKHFANRSISGLEALYIEIGKSLPISELLCEENLIFSTKRVGSNFMSWRNNVVIGGWFAKDTGRLELDNPDLYHPDIVHSFYREMGYISAEMWLYMLQVASGVPLARQDDKGVDVAAYLDDQGLPLSADFITRYPKRVNWCLQTYPDRKPELAAFAQKYGLQILTLLN